MSGDLTRRVIWIPVIHTEADLGNMSESVRQHYVERMGQEKWEQHVGAVREFWRRLQEAVEGLELDCARVRLYQDGLPNCGREAEIVAALAKSGSFNHQLLLGLMERGAQIMGTESPELLVQEYELARQLLAGGTQAENREPQECLEQDRRLLDMRDRYIAERIDQTLNAGETGLLFLGMLHSLEGRLPADVQVRRLCVEMPVQPTGDGTEQRL
jgi:hypothetical protein